MKYGVLILVFPVLLLVVCSQEKLSQTPSSQKPPQTIPQKTAPSGDEVDPDDVIRINTTLVNSPVLVIGRDGKFVPNLKREDFQIFEDGVPQEIAYFAPVEKPFTVAILIDTSRSTLFSLEDIKDAAISFVDKMRINDRALIISLAGEINVVAEATSDHVVLKQAIRKCQPGGNSRIFDAVSFVLKKKIETTTGRTAVILFSDGVDNDSREATYESTLEQAGETQALIYPIQFSTFRNSARNKNAPQGSGFSREDYVRADAFLHQAAAVSGTGVYPAQEISDLNTAISAITDELHNEYNVGYYPQNTLRPIQERRVEIRLRKPQLVLKARTSYSIERSGLRRKLAKVSAADSPKTPGAVPIERNTDDSKPTVGERWLCKGPDTPIDFVVVKEGVVSQCPKSERVMDQSNAWFIKKPGPTEVMCKGFLTWQGQEVAGAPIPSGYVVTGETVSSDCARSSDPQIPNNAWTIRQPSDSQTVCKGFPLPRGFVMVKEVLTAQCPDKQGKNAWVIRAK